ncbi:P-selectin glycoprotein ligand 1 [Orycteropus afer afer]|uniref:P-selectin glycoprotein ligand 1 n=1 Tax=Orycteropus afer afer TaxID=1230840 RepID=A0A8B7AZZ5_ORYAF|nr:P-selectin glycoprotein ligand 1 [Orycteropus afer afer]
MSLQLFLLLTLLGPGSSLHQPESWENRTSQAPGLLPTGGGREKPTTDDPEFDEDDYTWSTESSEMLDNNILAVTLGPETPTVMETLGQRGPAGPGSPEPGTVEPATRDSAGLGTGGAATGNLSTELATQGSPTAQDPLTTGLATAILPTTGASTVGVLPMEQNTTEALFTPSIGPTAMEALPTELVATGAHTKEPSATEALSTEPATTEALSTEPGTTEALSAEPATTEALSAEPGTTEALSVEPATTEALSTEPATMEASSTELVTTKGETTESATTSGLVMSPPVSSDTQSNTIVAVSKALNVSINQWRRQDLTVRSSVASSPTGVPDSIPVKQCLLAILILALVATIFLVCTVVLAIRLSRKNHTYPVRSYSPTEMVCISSLLPEGGEVPTASSANGGPPTAKDQDQKPELGEERDGDDLTLRSFLP